MSETLWQQLEPMLVNAIGVILPVAVGVVVAWLRARAQTLLTVRSAVREAEELGGAAQLTGEEKHAIALHRIALAKPGLRQQRASEMIEAVLPGVRRDSLPPQTPRSG